MGKSEASVTTPKPVLLDPPVETIRQTPIPSAALGKIGVTWNAPIKITSGLNKLSLTLANSSWSL